MVLNQIVGMYITGVYHFRMISKNRNRTELTPPTVSKTPDEDPLFHITVIIDPVEDLTFPFILSSYFNNAICL